MSKRPDLRSLLDDGGPPIPARQSSRHLEQRGDLLEYVVGQRALPSADDNLSAPAAIYRRTVGGPHPQLPGDTVLQNAVEPHQDFAKADRTLPAGVVGRRSLGRGHKV